MKNALAITRGSLVLIALLLLGSCEEKVDFTSSDSANVENEAATDGYFEDTDDMSTMAVAADVGTLNGSRSVSKDKLDARFACSTTVVTLEPSSDNSAASPHGIITIDFGTAGCTDSKGNVRKGKITVEYRGRRFQANSTIVTKLIGYEINGVKLEGTRTVTNITGSTEDRPKFTIKLEGGKATWADGTTATRDVERTREWIRAANPLNDQWNVTGNAVGTNRNGRSYEMTITKTLVYKRECAISTRVFIAVEGTKELTVDGKKITIDYGTGDCDRKVTITINGESREVEVKGDI